MMSRSRMYSEWGKLKHHEPWKGVYPNPTDAKDRFEFEMALIRRGASRVHEREVWKNYNFKMVTDGKDKIVSGSNLHPDEIMDIHYKVNLAAGISKFGKTREEAQRDMHIAKIIGIHAPDEIVEAVEREVSPLEAARLAYGEAKDKFSFTDVEQFLKNPSQFENAQAKGKELQDGLNKISRALQKIVDTAVRVDPSIAGVRRDSATEDKPKFLISDRASHTAALNLFEIVDELDNLADRVGANELNKNGLKKLDGSLAINIKKHIRKGDSNDFKQENKVRKIEGLPRTIAGSLTNLMGGLFEIAIEESLKNELSEIFEAVSALGAGGSAGSMKTYSGEIVSSKTSKRDISAFNKILKVDVGFSAKSQYASDKNKETKLLDTDTGFIRKVIAVNKAHDDLLEIGFSSESMWNTRSQMNRTIAALMADVALAGLEGDRVDYVVYRDAVIPIENYYLKKSGSFRFSGVKDSSYGGTAAESAASKIIDTGNTQLVFKAS